jgi:predicted membrane metal-binding protein
VTGRLYKSPGREPDRDVLFVSVQTVTAGGEERAVRGRLRLGVPFVRATRRRLDYLVGDRVRASVRLSSGGAFRNFGAFSYERYLQTLGIHRRGSTKSTLLVARISPAPAGSIRARVSSVRQSIHTMDALLREFADEPGYIGTVDGVQLEAATPPRRCMLFKVDAPCIPRWVRDAALKNGQPISAA